LAVGVLSAVREESRGGRRVVPPGIYRAVQSLETGIASNFSLTELAAQAQLSRSHFAQAFRQLTGLYAAQYLLRVRLSHARKLLAQEANNRRSRSFRAPGGRRRLMPRRKSSR
jgi:transcriptional regulator GlxA family with amidase domain